MTNGVAQIGGLERIERRLVDVLAASAGLERRDSRVVAGLHRQHHAALLGRDVADDERGAAFGVVATQAAADPRDQGVAKLRLTGAGGAMGQGGARTGMNRGADAKLCAGKCGTIVSL